MKLIIETKDFQNLKDKSTYNHNYYVNSKGTEILEICHENYDFYEYRLIEDKKWEFLGCSYSNFRDGETIEIDFREFYS